MGDQSHEVLIIRIFMVFGVLFRLKEKHNKSPLMAIIIFKPSVKKANAGIKKRKWLLLTGRSKITIEQ